MSSERNSYERRVRKTVKKPMTDKDFAKMQAEFDPLAKEELLLGKGQKRNQKRNHDDA